jgi:hypothetical protein
MHSEFLDGRGSIDRFGSLVVIRDVLVEGAFEISGVEQVVGLRVLALKQTSQVPACKRTRAWAEASRTERAPKPGFSARIDPISDTTTIRSILAIDAALPLVSSHGPPLLLSPSLQGGGELCAKRIS